MFCLDHEYLVKLNAYWSATENDTSGFAQYTMVINKSPKPKQKARKRRETQKSEDICFINPHNGTALKTEFQIKCEEGEIDDPDLPYLYTWNYRKSKDETWKSITYPTDGT